MCVDGTYCILLNIFLAICAPNLSLFVSLFLSVGCAPDNVTFNGVLRQILLEGDNARAQRVLLALVEVVCAVRPMAFRCLGGQMHPFILSGTAWRG